jgi:hypothetical protein
MGSFPEAMNEYKKQLERGDIQEAYQGLMEFFRGLKSHFKNSYPEYSVSGSIYYGYMDMTYFSLFPESLKCRNLKIAVVFSHEAFRFEVWLSGTNRNVQAKYWQWFKGNDWQQYPLASNPRAVDYVVEHVLVDEPDFSDLEVLTGQIESGTVRFITDMEGILSLHRD